MDTNEVRAHLSRRGMTPEPAPRVTTLTGGVSAAVQLVESGDNRWVVKQALPQLLVAAEWRATPRRALTEAAALRLVGEITPANVPVLLDVDEDHYVLVMTAAPKETVDWRSSLLNGDGDAESVTLIAHGLGRVLGAWHRATWQRDDVARQFDDDAVFDQLRLTPFHRTVHGLHPQLSSSLSTCIDELETVRECLVHGDFSPKNVLVGPDLLWVIDFEVARFGAAVFDLAFLGHHLALKAIVGPHPADLLAASYVEFTAGYRTQMDHSPRLDHLGWHIAALMLARVDGISPAGYLSARDAAVVRSAAMDILSSRDSSAAAAWDVVVRTAGDTR
jgi:tRNA A-37 threonylcarbamoyl transferase component Bud32